MFHGTDESCSEQSELGGCGHSASCQRGIWLSVVCRVPPLFSWLVPSHRPAFRALDSPFLQLKCGQWGGQG